MCAFLMHTIGSHGFMLCIPNLSFFVFKKFKSLVENQTEHKIHNLHTDNAREYISLTPFLHQHGTHHRVTCPYTHQQKGLVERKHRHIVDMGLLLLAHAYISLHFGVEAFISFVILLMFFHLMLYMVTHLIINSLTRHLIIFILKILCVPATLT